MKDNEQFDQAVRLWQELDGVTKKTAQRLVVDLVANPKKVNELHNALKIIDQSLSECPVCFYLAINGKCLICSDPSRDQTKILVVSSLLDAIQIETGHDYHGLYAITKGEINLSKGISPESLKIAKIFQRVNNQTELILAFNATFNGEVTANYLKDLAVKLEVRVSRIAKGIPSGAVLNNLDQLTLIDAIQNRKEKE